MAASTSASCAFSSPSTIANGRRMPRQLPAPRCVGLLPASPPPAKTITAFYRPKIMRNVIPLATGDSYASGESYPSGESSNEVVTETPEIVKAAQQAWEKLDDKYAVVTLGFSALIALWGSAGVITAIERLPLVPGVLELVGIGYTGWFAYRNLVFKPDREALIDKVKCTYEDILGRS